MSIDETPYGRMGSIIAGADGGVIEPGDFAVLLSLVAEISDSEISAVLSEFFDIEPLTMAIFDQFRAQGTEWSRATRQKLLEALIFCGYDEEADYMKSVQANSASD